jgi:hypothetical protein
MGSHLVLVGFVLLHLQFSVFQGSCNTTGATSGAGPAYPSGAPEFTPGV